MSETSRPYPQTIGPFRVLRPLGRGGAAAVYEVEDPSDGEHFALKLLTHHLSSVRFDREYHTLSRLDHPNIVRVFQFGFTDDRFPYITMELLDGVPAQAHAKAAGKPGSGLRTAEVVRIANQVALALDYLHSRQIVHRDLKSSNIMVLADGRVKLLDLGTARLMGPDQGITRQGEFLGTFTYASPEQVTGRPVDHRADLYSLGVLVYRLLTGRRPFETDDPNELARMHVETPPQPPRELVPALPAALSAFVLRLLAKHPDDRPPSARAVSELLQRSGLGDPPHALGPPWRAPLPLLGRTRELNLLRERFSEPRPGALLLLTGEENSGRQRMLSEIVAMARDQDFNTYIADFPGPFGLGGLEEVARAAARGVGGPEALAALNRVRGAPNASSTAARVECFDALYELLAARAQATGKPVLVGLQSLERARPMVLDAVSAIARRTRDEGTALMFVGTVLRPHEPREDDGEALQGHVEPSTGVAVIRAFPAAEVLNIGALGPRETGLLVSAMLGSVPPGPPLTRRIHEVTQGMPGAIDLLVRAGLRANARSPGRVALAPSLDQAIAVHQQSLSRLCVRVLEALACAGGEATADLIAVVADLPALELRAALLVLGLESMVVAVNDGGVEAWRLRSSLLTASLAARMGEDRVGSLRKRLMTALQAAPPTASKIRLLLASGHIDPAITEAVAWAERRLDDNQPEEVMPTLIDLVARLDEARSSSPVLHARLLLCHARAIAATDPWDQSADRSLMRAGTLAGDAARQAEVDLHTAELYRTRGETRRARARLTRALRLLTGNPNHRLHAFAHLQRAEEAEFSGDLGAAAAAFDDARRSAERAGDLRAAARARLGRARLVLRAGELAEAERGLIRAASAVNRLNDEAGSLRAALALATVARLRGQFSKAEQTLISFAPAARLAPDPLASARLKLGLVELALDVGEIDAAADRLDALRELPAQRLPPRFAARLAWVQGRRHLERGDPDSAAAILEQAWHHAQQRELVVPAALLLATLGEAQALAGGQGGRAAAERAVAALRELRQPVALTQACLSLQAAAGPQADPDATFAPVLEWLARSQVPHLQASVWMARASAAAQRGDTRAAAGALGTVRQLMEAVARELEAPMRDRYLRHPWWSAVDITLTDG